MHYLIEPFEEGDSLQVLTPAELVGDPFTFLARIVQVQHGGDGVHAQAVDVVSIQPKQRAGEQEAADFIAPVVENERTPVLVFALAQVGMLVKVRAVEEGEAVPVFGKMSGHPVDDDAQPGLVCVVDKVAKVVRRSIPRCGRVVANGLVAPRTIVGILRDGQELDVGEAHPFDVRH